MVLEVHDLQKFFNPRRRRFFSESPETVRAVDGVSFILQQGRSMGVVGVQPQVTQSVITWV